MHLFHSLLTPVYIVTLVQQQYIELNGGCARYSKYRTWYETTNCSAVRHPPVDLLTRQLRYAHSPNMVEKGGLFVPTTRSVASICAGLQRMDDREVIADALTQVAALPCSPEGLRLRTKLAEAG